MSSYFGAWIIFIHVHRVLHAYSHDRRTFLTFPGCSRSYKLSGTQNLESIAVTVAFSAIQSCNTFATMFVDSSGRLTTLGYSLGYSGSSELSLNLEHEINSCHCSGFGYTEIRDVFNQGH